MTGAFDAVILCGGGGRRLDGADKAALVVGDRSLLDRAVAAVASAHTTIAVGPRHETERAVVWTIEDPPGGGPVAAIAAGLELVTQAVVVVLGVDFPFVDAGHVLRLIECVNGDGAIVTDNTGRHQFLVGAYRVASLQASLAERDPTDMAVNELVSGLDLAEIDDPRAAQDCDTWADVGAADAALSSGEPAP